MQQPSLSVQPFQFLALFVVSGRSSFQRRHEGRICPVKAPQGVLLPAGQPFRQDGIGPIYPFGHRQPPFGHFLHQGRRLPAGPAPVPKAPVPGADHDDLLIPLFQSPCVGYLAGAAPVQIGRPLHHDHGRDEGHGGGGPGRHQDVHAASLFKIGGLPRPAVGGHGHIPLIGSLESFIVQGLQDAPILREEAHIQNAVAVEQGFCPHISAVVAEGQVRPGGPADLAGDIVDPRQSPGGHADDAGQVQPVLHHGV